MAQGRAFISRPACSPVLQPRVLPASSIGLVKRSLTHFVAPLSPGGMLRKEHRGKQQTSVPHVKAAAQQAGSSSSAESEPASHKGHAILHDFCMCIPYSCIVTLAGLLSLPFGGSQMGLVAAATGMLLLAASAASLKQWRQQRSSAPITAASAVASGLLTRMFWQTSTAGWLKWANLLMAGLSAVATAFFVYNIAAGGNPPKQAASATDLPAPQT